MQEDDFNSLFQPLIHRYENKRHLVDSHISSILNYEKIMYEYPNALHNFIECINKNIRALQVMVFMQNNLS